MLKAQVKAILFLFLLGMPGFVIVARMDVSVMLGIAILVFTVCALLGLCTARPVGLSSVFLNRLAGGKYDSLLSAFCFALIGGLVLGFLWVFSAWLFKSIVPKDPFGGISVWRAMLQGAVHEEIIFRWGFMSLILFIVWKVFGESNSKPSPLLCWISILLSSLPFSLSHLMNVWRLGLPIVSPFTVFLLAINFVAGTVLGWLYWKKGLESAILAHMGAHIVIFLNLKT